MGGWMMGGWMDAWMGGGTHHGPARRRAEDGARRDTQPMVARSEARPVEGERLRARFPVAHEQLESSVSIEVADSAARAVARRLERVADVDLGPVGVGG